MGDLSFKDVADAAAANAEPLCRRLLPNGKRVGDWWVTGVPWRIDKNPSFGVSLTTGKWKDFARGDHGDFIDLMQRMRGGTQRDAMREIARLVGLIP